MKRKQIIEKIRHILKQHGIKSAYFFGSFARKERRYHDIDIAVEPPEGKFSLLDLVGIEEEISRAVHKKVDLMTFHSISPFFKRYIDRDKVAII